MSRPDEGLIHAWLDGELDAAEAARVARLVETDAEWGAAAAEARGLVAASSRIVGALDVVPAGVIPAGSTASGAAAGGGSTRRRRFSVRPWMRVAAGLALVAGVGYVASRSMIDPSARVAGEADGAAIEAEAGFAARARDVIASDRAVPSVPAAPAASGGAGGPSAPPSGRAAVEEQREAAKVSVMAGAAIGASRDSAAPIAPSPQTVLSTVVPAPAPAEVESRVAAPAPITLRDTAALRRALESARTEGVVVTGARGAAAAPAAAPTAQLRPRVLTERLAPAAADAAGEQGRVLAGCWRTRTTAPADSVLVDPTILSIAYDSLVIATTRAPLDARLLRAPVPRATVVQRGTTRLEGTARTTDGTAVPFVAERTSCP